MRDSLNCINGHMLYGVDGEYAIMLDRDVTLYIGGNYIVGDHTYQVVGITSKDKVYVKSV